MANAFKINSNFTVKKYSTNYGELKQLPVPKDTEMRLQTQYENLQDTLQASGQIYDNRNWAEKMLGINADTKEHAGILRGTLDIITRPLDAVKSGINALQHGSSGQEVLTDILQGITQGKGKNLTGVQILGLQNAYLDTFTKFIVNVGVDIGLDPLTYVPAGVIFKGLKSVGTNTAKLPGISNVLQHAKTTELGTAVQNLYRTSKNQFGKAFKWMYGTSDDAKKLFSKLEADKAVTTNELFSVLNKMTKENVELGKDLHNYVLTGQLPGSKLFKDNKVAREELDKIVDFIGIENPEKTFKRWAETHYNGNIPEARKNFISFISDRKNKVYQQDWEEYLKSGAALKPDGTIKNWEEAAESFWLKKTNEWEQLTPEEISIRLSEGFYHNYLSKQPVEKTLGTVMKGLNTGEFPLPTNDPEAIRKFLKDFGEITGIHDPLLNAKWVERTVKDSAGKKVIHIDTEAIKRAEEALKAYKGNKQREILRLKNELAQAKLGAPKTELIDISGGITEELAKSLNTTVEKLTQEFGGSLIQSSYFNILSLKDYGKSAAKELEQALKTMSKSNDPLIKLEYMKMMQRNELNTVMSWLKDSEGKGVMISLKDNWNPKGLKFLDENGNLIKEGENAIRLSKHKTGDSVKKYINKEITKGLEGYLNKKITAEVLSDGIIGKVVKDWSILDGLTKQNSFEVANKLTNELIKTKVKMPAYQLNPLKGYLSEKYVQDITYVNSEMYRLFQRFGLDTTDFQKANILRNVTNPELAKYMRLIEINKNIKSGSMSSIDRKFKYSGLDPEKLLNSKWLLNAPEINHALGYKLLSTDPIASMAETLKMWPESLKVSSMLKSAIKTKDIRALTQIEKISYEIKKVVPDGKKLISSNEIVNRLEGIRNLIPPDELIKFDKAMKHFGDEKNLLISIGLDDQLANIARMKSEAPKIVDYLNKYISVWKKALLFTPGYHMRNMTGGISQAVSAGIPMHKFEPALNQAFQDISQVHKITDKISTKLKTTAEILDTDAKFLKFTESFLTPYEHNLFHEYKSLMRNGITGQAKINSDYWELMGTMAKTAKKDNKFKKGLNDVFNANMRLSQSMDDGIRLAAYRISMENPGIALKAGLKGNTVEELSQSFVRTTFFDYHALTSFEKNTMRKFIPFYTWSRKNLEYQIRTLINRPEKFSRMVKIFDAWGDAQEYNAEEKPDWIKNNMWLPIVNGENVKYIKIGLPQQDIGEIFAFNGNILSRLNPFYKLMFESITGQNVYTKEDTTPLESAKGMFWQPLQKLLVQPFDIPVGALPLGNGKTIGDIFGHPGNYTQRNSMWYEQNIKTLHQSYLWQQINSLTAFRQKLKSMGIEIQTKQQMLKKLQYQKFPTKTKLQGFKQYKISSKDWN